jgi:hypothetical protein
MGFFLQMGTNSSFRIHHSSLLFGNDEVVRRGAVRGGGEDKIVYHWSRRI